MPELRLPAGTFSGRALIFDKDGVLLDFHRFWGEVARLRILELTQRAALGATEAQELGWCLGIPSGCVDPSGPLAVGTRQDGLSIAAAFLYRRGMPWNVARSLAEEAFDAAENSLDWERAVAPLGALLETLESLSERGWKLAIATTDRTRNAVRHAEMLGIAPMLGAIVGADAVTRSKPHADLVLACSEQLGIRSSECLVVGDTVADLLMARAAGCVAAIGVLSGVSSRDMLAPHADVLLEGVWELLA